MSLSCFVLVNKINSHSLKRIDTGDYISSIFIDLKKAFQTVDLSVLCGIIHTRWYTTQRDNGLGLIFPIEDNFVALVALTQKSTI